MDKGQLASFYTVPESADCNRLDLFLSQVCPTYSRSYFKKLIDQEFVKVNNKTINKAGFSLRTEDIVEFSLPPFITEHKEISSIKGVEIIYEHEHFLIINKPAGLVVHKGHKHDTQVTLVDWLIGTLPYLSHVGIPERPGIVHRLDKDTSGLMVIARTNYGHTQLSNLFKNRAIQKTYLALVDGHPDAAGTLNLPIGRHPVHKHKMTVFDSNNKHKSREAVSHYRVITHFDNHSLIEIKPVTGRTHQIRVHMTALGHPLIGDTTYNSKKTNLIDRHALHAFTLSFLFDGQHFSFTAPIAHDFEQALETLKNICKQ